jgi:hypothetical protein
LRLQREVTLSPGTRFVLLDIDAPEVSGRALLASACRAVPLQQGTDAISFQIEGVANTPGAALLRAARAPRSVLLAGQAPEAVHYDAEQEEHEEETRVAQTKQLLSLLFFFLRALRGNKIR